jgi:acyl carrier protein
MAPRLGTFADSLQLSFTDDAKQAAMQLLELANAKLLKQMVPSLWVVVNALPRTVSGKLNRKVLKDFFQGLSLEDQGRVADFLLEREQILPPKTNLEKVLHGLWASCLNISPERLGVNDSFASLGADSLSTVRLAAILRKAGFLISPVEIRKLKTIASVAKVLEEHAPVKELQVPVPSMSLLRETARDLEVAGIESSQVEAVIPATPFQRGTLSQLSESDRSYMCRMPFILEKTIDVERLSWAIEQLTLRHAILRTAFLPTKQHSLVQIQFSIPPRLFVVYSREHSPLPNEAGLLDKLFARHVWGEVPFYPVLVQYPNARAELIFYIHHALYDGWR